MSLIFVLVLRLRCSVSRRGMVSTVEPGTCAFALAPLPGADWEVVPAIGTLLLLLLLLLLGVATLLPECVVVVGVVVVGVAVVNAAVAGDAVVVLVVLLRLVAVFALLPGVAAADLGLLPPAPFATLARLIGSGLLS